MGYENLQNDVSQNDKRIIMDTSIVVGGLLAFGVFLAAQIVVFRFTPQDAAVRWIGKLYCLVSAVLFLFTYTNSELAIGSFLVYTGLAAVYIFWVFGAIEASLTLRILAEIAQSQEGITSTELLDRYNRETIIARRIERLAESGELIRRGNAYERSDTVSFFLLREYVSRLVKWFFPRGGGRT